MGEDDTEAREMMGKSRIVMWQKMFEHSLHSDRLAGEIGVFVLKIVLVINGGALIAIMAAYKQFGDGQEVVSDLTEGGRLFLWGLLFSVLASTTAYFYQSFVTRALWNDMQKEFGAVPKYPWSNRASKLIIWVATIPLTVASYGLFARGAYKTLHAMELVATSSG